MRPISIRTLKDQLQRKGLAPNKRLSQNFLIASAPIEKLIQASRLEQDNIVIEIGPGLGVLTKELAQRAYRVVAVEKDRGLADSLKEEYATLLNVEIIQGDILTTSIPFPRYKVVANLPFSITGPVLRKFLEASPQPTLMTLLIQKEVAQRICASPPHMSILAASVQFYADPKIFSYVKSGSFWPRPKVDSAIIQITPKSLSPKEKTLAPIFFRVLKAGFSQPRKQLANNLSKKLSLRKEIAADALRSLRLDPAQRPSTLAISDWMRLAEWYTMQ